MPHPEKPVQKPETEEPSDSVPPLPPVEQEPDTIP